MKWLALKTTSDLEHIKVNSFLEDISAIAIFKHSSRCAISMMAKSRLMLTWDFNPKELPIYYLDLIQYRNLSNEIADNFNIPHQSPQLLLIKNGKCIYDVSHTAISVKELKKTLELKS